MNKTMERRELLKMLSGAAIMKINSKFLSQRPNLPRRPLSSNSRLSYNPYGSIDWKRSLRCLAQHHDHVQTNESSYRAYDEAGYQAVTVLHYSGVKSLGYTWTDRKWPLTLSWMGKYSSDKAFLKSCKNLKILIPGAEEVGFNHITSPFLTKYIAKWEPGFYDKKEEWHYESAQECIDLIVKYGGLAFIAHPFYNSSMKPYLAFRNYRGIEIFNAYYLYNLRMGKYSQDLNNQFVDLWDVLLDNVSTQIWGIAVNDWYGPWNQEVKTRFPGICDSGKIVALVEQYTLGHYRKAIEEGSFFAIRDVGKSKGLTPNIVRINYGDDSISIEANGSTKWKTNGGKIVGNETMRYSDLPSKATYIRAEVSNENGTVYTQPFTLNR